MKLFVLSVCFALADAARADELRSADELAF
jgi:hypothetical protein